MSLTGNSPSNLESQGKAATENGLKPGDPNSAETLIEPGFYKIL